MGLSERNIIGIIQCRTGSKRLPDKALLPLAGKPMITNYIQRVKRSKLIDQVVLATTTASRDDVLCAIANQERILTYRGSEDDVIERLFKCSKHFNATEIVRLCADNPMVEPRVIDALISKSQRAYADFSSNAGDIWDYPDGLGAEYYSILLLNDLNTIAVNREHPHRNWNIISKYFVHPIRWEGNAEWMKLKLDVNTKEDYEFIKSIYDRYGHNKFHVTDYVKEIVQWQ